MTRVKEAALPAYLLLCLLLGGSSQAIWGNAFLQLCAVGILAWSVLTREPAAMVPHGSRLLMIAAAAILLVLIQLVPLPPGLWAGLPGRQFIADGFALLGMPLPWLPLSLAPYDTMTTALSLLPPLALLVGMLRLRHWRAFWMFAAIAAAAVVAIALGLLQVSSGDERWYFYRWTNIGVAVGTFANGNHFATLLLAAVPLIVALAVQLRDKAKGKSAPWGRVALALAVGSILAVGLVINGSTAMVVIGPAVAVATLLLVVRLSPSRRRQGLMLSIGLLAVAGAGVAVGGRGLPGVGASLETRQEYWTVTLRALEDHWLTGTGFGSFVQTYRRFENPENADRWFTNHAHNDYLELALEGGAPAVLLLVVFLIWWAGRARDSWTGDSATLEQKAAAIASAAILLHSLFDYPLRMAGLAAVFATCLALLAGARGAAPRNSAESERIRHATL